MNPATPTSAPPDPDQTVRTVLVDDHDLIVEGLELLIGKEPKIAVVGRGGTAADAIDLIERFRPDVLVIDLDLPDRSGFEVIREVAPSSDTAVVVLSASSDTASMAEAFDAGALAYVPKADVAESLLSAILLAARGEQSVPPNAVGPIMQGLRTRHAAREEAAELRAKLSRRETEVLRSLSEGKTVQETAQILHVSVFTLRGHVRNLLAKLEVHSIAQAVALTYKLGMFDGEPKD